MFPYFVMMIRCEKLYSAFFLIPQSYYIKAIILNFKYYIKFQMILPKPYLAPWYTYYLWITLF